jgi:SAM-dependent methyltransferase
MNNFEVIDFRFAEVSDDFDKKYMQIGAWSRPYEYLFVSDFIKKNKLDDLVIPEIHNTSWGFEGIHVTFRDDLDVIGKCVHSDIVHSQFRTTHFYDITTENKEFENKFDFVLNVSTIEHLSTAQKRIISIENLYKQVKPNGYLVLTFDYPSVNLLEIETLVNTKCKLPLNILNGKNSVNPYKNYENLNVVYLILKKNG